MSTNITAILKNMYLTQFKSHLTKVMKELQMHGKFNVTFLGREPLLFCF